MRGYDKAAGLALIAMVLAACSLAAVSCAREGQSRALLPEGYGTWRSTTAVKLDYPIPGHEASARAIFMNPEGFLFQKDGDGAEFPAGTIIVKEIRPLGSVTADMPAPMLTAMVKAPEDERARGGWLWVVKDTASGSETVFAGDFCYRCHANANEAHPYADRNPSGASRDFVFFVPGLDTPALDPLSQAAISQALEPADQPSGDGD